MKGHESDEKSAGYTYNFPFRPEKIEGEADGKTDPESFGDIKKTMGGENVKGEKGRICGGNI